jgi:hypothetical protein
MSWWVPLDDGRLVVASTMLASTQVLTPTLTVAANLPAFPSMSTAVRANGQLDLASGSSASVLRYDASTYVAGAPVTATSPTRTAWSCGPGSPYLLTRKGDRLVRVTAATWQDDPTFGVGGQVAIPTGALLAVDAACRFAFVAPGATTTITSHDASGQAAAPITVGFVTGTASAARYDTAGRLVVSSTDVDDELRLARVDLAAGGLDPSFGTAGIARLDVPRPRAGRGGQRLGQRRAARGQRRRHLRDRGLRLAHRRRWSRHRVHPVRPGHPLTCHRIPQQRAGLGARLTPRRPGPRACWCDRAG